MTALVETSYKLKFCPKCDDSHPLSCFTSTRAKYCKACTKIHKLELRNAMMQRSLERTKTKKQKTKTVASMRDLKKLAQKYFNAYIRLRDKDLPCISCGATTARAWHAGHYWAQGMNGYLRFHQGNVNKQCDSCNVWKHGNLLNYRIGLIEKWGENKAKWLDENHNKTHKYTREELEAIISKYKQLTEAK